MGEKIFERSRKPIWKGKRGGVGVSYSFIVLQMYIYAKCKLMDPD